jgi:hypothetical protein
VSLPDVGDWARVVTVCPCGCDEGLGEIVLVTRIAGPTYACQCPGCGVTYFGPMAWSPQWESDDSVPLHWLRRIPPESLVEERELEMVTL